MFRFSYLYHRVIHCRRRLRMFQGAVTSSKNGMPPWKSTCLIFICSRLPNPTQIRTYITSSPEHSLFNRLSITRPTCISQPYLILRLLLLRTTNLPHGQKQQSINSRRDRRFARTARQRTTHLRPRRLGSDLHLLLRIPGKGRLFNNSGEDNDSEFIAGHVLVDEFHVRCDGCTQRRARPRQGVGNLQRICPTLAS